MQRGQESDEAYFRIKLWSPGEGKRPAVVIFGMCCLNATRTGIGRSLFSDQTVVARRRKTAGCRDFRNVLPECNREGNRTKPIFGSNCGRQEKENGRLS